jgi:hypothetical protein
MAVMKFTVKKEQLNSNSSDWLAENSLIFTWIGWVLTCCLKTKQVGMTVVLFLESFDAEKVLTYDIRVPNEADTCKYQTLVRQQGHMLDEGCQPTLMYNCLNIPNPRWSPNVVYFFANQVYMG